MPSLVWTYARRLKSGKRSYYLAYSKRLGLKSECLHTDDKAIAQTVCAQRNSQLILAKHGIIQPTLRSVKFSAFSTLYLQTRTTDGIKPGTLAGYKFALEMFGKLLQVDKKVHLITEEHVRSYITTRRSAGVGSKAIRNELGTLHNAFSWGIKKGYLAANPLQDIPLPTVPKRRPDDLTIPDYRLLQKKIPDRYWRLVFDFYILAGPRRNEAPQILISRHVDIKRGILFIPQEKQESSNPLRAIPLVGQLKTTVQQLVRIAKRKRSDRLLQHTGDAIYRRLKHYAQLAGIKRNVRLHSLRHTFGTLLGETQSQRTIQELIGHSDPRSTQIYVHPVNSTMVQAMRKVKLPRIR